MRRIVFTSALGSPAQFEGALGLGRSLKLIGDTTPRAVVADSADEALSRCFSRVLPAGASLEATASRLLAEGFEQVLYLAPEYLAMKRIGPLFGLGVADEGRLQGWGTGGRLDEGLLKELLGVARKVAGRVDLDVGLNRCRWVEHRDSARLLEPILFRAGEPKAYRAYRRQLTLLAALDRYEQQHSFGYVSAGHKLRRSVEKRILKLQGRL